MTEGLCEMKHFLGASFLTPLSAEVSQGHLVQFVSGATPWIASVLKMCGTVLTLLQSMMFADADEPVETVETSEVAEVPTEVELRLLVNVVVAGAIDNA